MRHTTLLGVAGCLALLAGAAAAQSPDPGTQVAGTRCQPPAWFGAPPYCPTPAFPAPPGTTPPGTTPPETTPPGATAPETTPPGTTAPETTQPPNDAFAQAPEAGTQAAGSVDPALFGDLLGIRGRRVVLVPKGVTRGALPPGTQLLGGNIASVIAPLPLHASYKIGENESPRPTDRVYFANNFYDNVDRLFPGDPQSNLNRETIGFEKTFLNGDASFGLRLPFLQLVGDGAVEDNEVGDLSLIYKYALYNDRQTGNLFSTGVVLTVPTGQGLQIEGESTLNSTVVQPFIGYVYHIDKVYIEGFSSVAVPSDFRDVTLMFNSVAVGYRLYNDPCGTGFVTGVLPQAEFHVNTPLSHRGLDSIPVNFSDSVDLTLGCHFLMHHTDFGCAVCAPVLGPKPYDVEAAATLAFRW